MTAGASKIAVSRHSHHIFKTDLRCVRLRPGYARPPPHTAQGAPHNPPLNPGKGGPSSTPIWGPVCTPFDNIKVYGLNAEVNWDLGPATLTILPAYRRASLKDHHYVPGFSVIDHNFDEQTSIETRLGNSDSALKWVIGGYYFDENQRETGSDSLIFVEQGVNTQDTGPFRSNVRSYAGFGQATYSVTPAFRVTGGLRYTYERKRQDGLTRSYGFPVGPGLCNGSATFDPSTPTPPLFCRNDVSLTGRLSYMNWTYKVGVELDVAPQSMAYINYGTGFKSGGFFGAPPPNVFRPEKLRSLEAGIKNRLFNNQLQLNIEGFYWKYKDHQEAHLGPTTLPGFFTFITENAGSAKSYGGEVSVQWRATRNDNFNLGVQYNRSRYDKFTYTNLSTAFGPPTTGCQVGPLTNGVQEVDCSGLQLVRSPTWSGTAAYTHTFDLSNGGRVEFSGAAQFSSSYYLSIDFLKSGQQDSYALLQADLTYTAPDDRWSLTGYVHNITNQAVATQGFRFPFVSAANPLLGQDSLFLATLRPPRTFGARLHYNF